MEKTLNVLGSALKCCCNNPKTGFYRDGNCQTGPMDTGRHLICARMTAPFLKFSFLRGNDLTTPRPEYQFPGLKPGDRWCLCALRWVEAYDAGFAPPVILEATHEDALRYTSLESLREYAIFNHPEEAAEK
ncbi:MAG: DUF2237 domain-containing protein [Saprospiraceae bacterium]|nr:DUF2237 domain-containing protein [Lewinella sp.]